MPRVAVPKGRTTCQLGKVMQPPDSQAPTMARTLHPLMEARRGMAGQEAQEAAATLGEMEDSLQEVNVQEAV